MSQARLKPALKRAATQREQIQRRIDVLSKLLDNPEPMYAIGCHCMQRSRLSVDHAENCPYRLTREVLRDLQRSTSAKSGVE